jgi:hypothetical protein
MADDKHWDVFLSYSSPDLPEVERLARRLEDEAHLAVFLDRWRLVPGQGFIGALAEAIRISRSCALFLGKGEMRPWQNQEVQAALNQAVRSSGQAGTSTFRVIPVLLPGARDPAEDELPAFLATFIGLRTWVDFRGEQGLDDAEEFARLVAGIRGTEPGRPRVPPAWLTTIDVPGLRRPTGVAVDGAVLFLADHETGSVMRVEHREVVASSAGLLKPHHLVVMADTLVVTDTHHHALAFYDLDLTLREKKAQLGEYTLRRPHGLSSNYPNEFYLTDADHHRVLRVQDGEVTASAGRPGCQSGSDAGEFSIPCGVAASPDCVYVADTFNHRVQVLTRDLRAVSSFGRMGHGAGEFAYPVAVASWHQWIVVSDEHNTRLQLWRREGAGLPFTASCVSADLCGDWLGSPFGLVFDEDGRLLVADRKDGKVLRIDFEKMLERFETPTTDRPRE